MITGSEVYFEIMHTIGEQGENVAPSEVLDALVTINRCTDMTERQRVNSMAAVVSQYDQVMNGED